MVEGFNKGFMTTSSQAKRKGGIDLTLTPTFFLTSWNLGQPGIIQRNQKNLTFGNSNSNSIFKREAKEADEVCPSPGGFLIQSFWLDEYGAAHKSDPKPPGRGLKIEAFERKTNYKARRKELNGRVSYRQLRALNGYIIQHPKSLGYEHNQAKGSCYEIRIGDSTSQRIKNETTEYWINFNGCRTLSLTSDETNSDQEEMLLLRKPTTSLSELSEIPIETTGFLISKANRKNRLNKIFCNKNGRMYKKKMELNTRLDWNLGRKTQFKNPRMGTRNFPIDPNILINSEELEALYS